MALVGYQDWQRVQYSSGYAIGTVHAPVTGTSFFGPYNVQNWNSVIAFLFNFSNSETYAFDFIFYDDQALTTTLGVLTYVVTNGQAPVICVPCSGPWLEIRVRTQIGGDPSPLTINLSGSMNILRPEYLNPINDTFLTQSIAYLANTNTQTRLSSWYNGGVLVDAYSNLGGPAFVKLEFARFGSGAWIEFATVPAPAEASATAIRFSLPPCPVRASVFNGGTAQSITVNVTPVIGT